MSDPNAQRKRCGAKTRSGGECQGWGMANGRCRIHGGATPRGAAHPNFTIGRYSKEMPQRMADRFHTALQDQTLLDLTAEIAVLDTRLAQLMERLEVPDVLGVLRDVRAQLRILDNKGVSDARRAQAMETLRETLSTAKDDTADWTAILNMIDRRRRLVESERKRRIETNTTMTIEELVNTSTALANLALRYIPEGPARDGYIIDVQRIFSLQRQGNVSDDLQFSTGAIDAGEGPTVAE